MIHNDKVLGKPLVQYTDTRANIEAITNPEQGMLAYDTTNNKLIQYNGSVWEEISSSSSMWYNVKDYGAVGNGIDNDTTAIQNTIDAIPDKGGVLYFPIGTYLTNGGFILNHPIFVTGDGNSIEYDDSNIAASKINCTSSTDSLFIVTSYGCSFDNLVLNNISESTPTDGAGITVSSGGDSMNLTRLTVIGFYINIDMQDGFQWVMNACYLFSSVLYGLKMNHIDLPDGGDQSISNSYFASGTRNSIAGVRIETGGGPKFINCKWNGFPGGYGFDYCIDIEVAENTTTVAFLVANCSIENYKISGINVKTNSSKPSKWSEWIIKGNEFGAYVYPSVYAINFDIDALHDVGDIIIAGNLFIDPSNPSTSAINLVNVNNAYISADNLLSNEYGTYASLVSQTGCTNIVIEEFIPQTTLGHYEILMSPGIIPPDPILNPDGTDWIYVEVL